MINGMINVYKEPGFTSHDVVAKLRGILKQKKIGHTGTLDPDAAGVLPVCLGSATKVCGLLTDKDKTYQALLRLGVETDTQDASGTILSEHPVEQNGEEIREAILSFVGEYDQIPPMYSALKVNGKKLYELAREGKTVERTARKVMIHQIEILSVDLDRHEVQIEVSCSKGTYIRTLCHDIGVRLGCGGIMAALIRTKAGSFSLEKAKTLSQLEELVKQNDFSFLLPVESVFLPYKAFQIKPEAGKRLSNGNELYTEDIFDVDTKNPFSRDQQTAPVRVYDESGHFCALYQYTEEKKRLSAVKMFLER